MYGKGKGGGKGQILDMGVWDYGSQGFQGETDPWMEMPGPPMTAMDSMRSHLDTWWGYDQSQWGPGHQMGARTLSSLRSPIKTKNRYEGLQEQVEEQEEHEEEKEEAETVKLNIEAGAADDFPKITKEKISNRNRPIPRRTCDAEVPKTTRTSSVVIKLKSEMQAKQKEVKEKRARAREMMRQRGMSTLIGRTGNDGRGGLASAQEMGWKEIEVTIDSGACDTVIPSAECSEYKLHESEQSQSGMEYEVANGESIPNLGERRCLMMTEGSRQVKRINFQVVDVHKALLSVSRAADMGFECKLGRSGGTLTDTVTQEVIPIKRNGNLYTMRAWVRECIFGGPR